MRALLTTPRLQLSPFSLANTKELHELFSDPLTHTTGSGPFTSISQTEHWIRNRVTALQEHGLCMYALRERETNTLIGNCGMLKGRTTYTEPEIGYIIRKTHQGHGFASEAAAAVIDECRAAGIRRAWASIRPNNTPSRRIAERLGMRVQRTDHDDRGPLIFYVIDLCWETEWA